MNVDTRVTSWDSNNELLKTGHLGFEPSNTSFDSNCFTTTAIAFQHFRLKLCITSVANNLSNSSTISLDHLGLKPWIAGVTSNSFTTILTTWDSNHGLPVFETAGLPPMPLNTCGFKLWITSVANSHSKTTAIAIHYLGLEPLTLYETGNNVFPFSSRFVRKEKSCEHLCRFLKDLKKK